MPDSTHTARVVPAHLGCLAIYNPSFGTTDETVRNQIVYYFSSERRIRHDYAGREGTTDEEEESEENERLRQIGLAQGMVDFAKNFSNGAPVDTVETEKTRLVLRELEAGWWILASINLTQLPSTKQESLGGESTIDFSPREVAPPQLLAKQLLQAHSIFLLHHAAGLHDLYQRVGRPEFCSLLDRFWSNFVKSWDVMLHGNPAVDIYRGIKLAAGGELGIGVGEEEWGSGEREVLEDFVLRTEGLTDLIVSRFGDAPVDAGSQAKNAVVGSNPKPRPVPWLGTGEEPRSSDGVIFSGTGAISRHSLESISQWVEAIFTHGEHGYGVGESPSSRYGRRRRKAAPKSSGIERDVDNKDASHGGQSTRLLEETRDIRRNVSDRQTRSPRIPPPLVPPNRTSLPSTRDSGVGQKKAGDSPPAKQEAEDSSHDSRAGTDNMMTYLTLGYGTAWTLNPKGFRTNPKPDNESSTDATAPSTKSGRSRDDERKDDADVNASSVVPKKPSLQELDPAPEVSDEEDEPFVQRLEQSSGKFIIGLLGDLERMELEEGIDDGSSIGARRDSQHAQRIVLRTLTVEMSRPQNSNISTRSESVSSTHNSAESRVPPTSASSSVDGARPILHHKKLQVAVYVHQPFIFVFLFDLHTSNLSMTSFYRDLHHRLGPLQKPLLRSTDPRRIAERIADVMGERSGTTSPATAQSVNQTIYDVIFDPHSRTVRTSIPNIPVPGSLAAEGLTPASTSVTVSGSWYTLGIPVSHSHISIPRSTSSGLIQSPWTRVDALNVHTQILNSWIAARTSAGLEMTVKTARGWWVLWTLVPSKNGPAKEAFLVRKAAEYRRAAGSNRDGRSSGGKWLLGEQQRDVSGSSTASGQTMTTAGVSEGVGVDARKWIDGLLHLNM